MTGRVEGLETGFYTQSNSVKGDNTQPKTQKTELIYDWRRAFSATKKEEKHSGVEQAGCPREVMCQQEGVDGILAL